MQTLTQVPRKRAFPLATGQLTSYGSGTTVDDGALRRGIAKPTAAYTILTTGQYALTTNITINSKTDVHSNACVEDNNTGLMWSRTVAASVGPTSNGRLPWTNNANGEGIFPFCLAANAASLAGFSDWRIPYSTELITLANYEAWSPVPNATAFPSWPTNHIWTNSTQRAYTTSAYYFSFYTGGLPGQTKTDTTINCVLVRG